MDKKTKYKYLIIFFSILLVISLWSTFAPSSSGKFNVLTANWEWQLTEGWNQITFTQAQIDACDSDSPPDVLVSIDPYWDFIFEDGTRKNFWWNQEDPSMDGGTLQNIKPNILYHINVTQDCVLIISPEYPPTIEVQTSYSITALGTIGFIGVVTSSIQYLRIKV